MKRAIVALFGGIGVSLVAQGADAAVKIASQPYVDKKSNAILETVQSTYETKEVVAGVSSKVDGLDDSVNNPETGLKKQVSDAVDTTEALSGTVSALGQQVSEKEDSKNKAGTINAENQSSSTQYPSVGAIVQWTNEKITELSESGLPVNPDNIGDGTITEAKLANGSVTTEKIADDAVTEDKLSNDVVSKIDGKADTSYVDEGLAAKEDKINKVSAAGFDSAAIAPDSDTKYPSVKAVVEQLAKKQDAGDYVTSADLANKADVSALESLATKEEVALKADKSELGAYAKSDSLATVATTGSYNDLLDKPTIPEGSVVDSELTAEGTNAVQGKVIKAALDLKADKVELSNYATKTELGDYAKTETVNAELATKQNVSNIVQAIRAEAVAEESKYPSEKAVATALDSKADVSSLTVLATKEEVAGKEDSKNKVGTISLENQSSSTQYPSVGAIVQWTNDKITELSESGLPVNPDNIGDGSITEAKLANGSVTTEKIADDAVTEDKLSNEVVSKIDGKEDTKNKVSLIDASNESNTELYTSVKAVADYAIPKPSSDCFAQSGRCVLSVSTDGSLMWVDVTSPAE